MDYNNNIVLNDICFIYDINLYDFNKKIKKYYNHYTSNIINK